jgi:hypothetical protein
MKENVQEKEFPLTCEVQPASVRGANLIYTLARKITYEVRFPLQPPGNTLTLYFIELERSLIKDNGAM